MTSSFVRSSVLALVALSATASFANAGTPYDGRWSLSITTTRGSCDTYNFPVDITNGQVSFPGLAKANGRVTGKGEDDHHRRLPRFGQGLQARLRHPEGLQARGQEVGRHSLRPGQELLDDALLGPGCQGPQAGEPQQLRVEQQR